MVDANWSNIQTCKGLVRAMACEQLNPHRRPNLTHVSFPVTDLFVYMSGFSTSWTVLFRLLISYLQFTAMLSFRVYAIWLGNHIISAILLAVLLVSRRLDRVVLCVQEAGNRCALHARNPKITRTRINSEFSHTRQAHTRKIQRTRYQGWPWTTAMFNILRTERCVQTTYVLRRRTKRYLCEILRIHEV